MLFAARPFFLSEAVLLRQLWQQWLHLARLVGNFQSRAMITLVYFILLAPFGLLMRLTSDVMETKAAPVSGSWRHRQTHDLSLNDARRQG